MNEAATNRVLRLFTVGFWVVAAMVTAVSGYRSYQASAAIAAAQGHGPVRVDNAAADPAAAGWREYRVPQAGEVVIVRAPDQHAAQAAARQFVGLHPPAHPLQSMVLDMLRRLIAAGAIYIALSLAIQGVQGAARVFAS